jgi:hypothetical protein
MKAPRENAKSHPASGTVPTAGRGDSGINLEQVQPRGLRIQCPNPTCRKVHIVDGRLAGQKGRCSCGAVIPIPAARGAGTPSQPTSSGKQASPRATQVHRPAVEREEAKGHEPVDVTEIRIGCIGRGNAGKTVLFRALAESLVGDFFPSGLHVDVGDPREVARLIHETEQAHRLLRKCGLPPTEHVSQTRCYLFDGDEHRVVYQLREVIGQILTHTLPDSAANLQAQYNEYLKNLLTTHVLWVMVPSPPPNPDARDRRRYANDLRIALAYLREALRLRTLKQPAAVALVLSKIDTLFDSAAEARGSLTDEVLLESLGPLVNLIEKSKRVSEAVIVPVTAFGFGNAVRREAESEQEGAEPRSEDQPFAGEPVWLLLEGATPEPFNLDALFLWTLVTGLVHAAGPEVLEAETDLGVVCRTLQEDLEAIDPWLVPIKGGLLAEGTPGRRTNSAASA